jgi:hypothetical protein
MSEKISASVGALQSSEFLLPCIAEMIAYCIDRLNRSVPFPAKTTSARFLDSLGKCRGIKSAGLAALTAILKLFIRNSRGFIACFYDDTLSIVFK